MEEQKEENKESLDLRLIKGLSLNSQSKQNILDMRKEILKTRESRKTECLARDKGYFNEDLQENDISYASVKD